MISGKDIVCIASSDYDSPSWLNVQYLMTGLARAGNRVLYLDSIGLRKPQWHHASDLRKIARRLRRLFTGMHNPLPNLYVMAPHALPTKGVGWLQRFNQWMIIRQIRSTLRNLQMRAPILWIFLPTGHFLVGRLGESQLIYHCVDDYLTNPGVAADALRKMEEDLVAQADLVIVTAPALFEKFKSRAERLALVPSGVDLESYRRPLNPTEPGETTDMPHPRIGFAGNLAEYKVNFVLLEFLIRSRPHWNFVFIGGLGGGDPSTKRPAFLDSPNVRWIGEKAHGELPAYMHSWDAGIIPYQLSRATDAVFPMKLFEYFAAGLPVVATPLPALAPYKSYCRLTGDEALFAQALEDVIRDPKEGVAGRMAVASQNSWNARLEQISELIALTKKRQATIVHDGSTQR